jgi:hypothetical protein
METVYIFGAGATRGALSGPNSRLVPPVDIDFFDIANHLEGHSTPELAKRVLEFVWRLYGRTAGISLERYYRDIETREAIQRFAKPPNQPMNWLKRRSDLEELIRRVMLQTTGYIKNEISRTTSSKLHRDILFRLRAGDTLITFNYDLVIEEALFGTGFWTPRDGYGLLAAGVRSPWAIRWFKNPETPAESKILLLKLHGSLNWAPGNRIKIKKLPLVIRKRNSGGPARENVLILPPGWNKKIYTRPFSALWAKARNKLEHCSRLVIIGYSMPETDLLAQALFSELIRSRNGRGEFLRELHLADPSMGIKERFTELFTPALGPRGSVFKYSGIEEYEARMGKSASG